MEFSFDLEFLWFEGNGLSVWDGEYEYILKSAESRTNFCKMVDVMGSLSAKVYDTSIFNRIIHHN